MEYYSIDKKHHEILEKIEKLKEKNIKEASKINSLKEDVIKVSRKSLNPTMGDEDIVTSRLKVFKNMDKIHELEKKMDDSEMMNYYTKAGNTLIANEFCSRREKMDIVKDYMNLYDPKIYYDTIKKMRRSKKCELCGSISLKNVLDGTYECKDCYHINYFSVDKVKDNSKIVKVNKYQRSDYFIEYIRKFLIKKLPTNIDDKFFKRLKRIIRNDGIKDFKKVTPGMLDRYLKKMKKTSFTYYKSFILMQLNGTPAPHISSDDLNWMQEMFKEVEMAWNEIKTTDDYSFPFYPFCIYKILELGEDYDDYLEYWRLSDSHDSVRKLNEIWKKICDLRGFEYIRTYVS